MKKIYLIRHSQSEKNKFRRFDKKKLKDSLTEQGVLESYRIAGRLQHLRCSNSIIITGERERALQTAEIVSNELSLNFCIKDCLKSIDSGNLKGMDTEQAESEYPALMKLRKNFELNKTCGYNINFPNGESVEEFETKINGCFESAIQEFHDKENIVFLTHRSVIIALLNKFHKELNTQRQSSYKYYDVKFGNVHLINYRIEKKEIHLDNLIIEKGSTITNIRYDRISTPTS